MFYTIYTIVAHFGLDSELDSMICWKLEEAINICNQWKHCEQCDSASIYENAPDKQGFFRTKRMVYNWTREGE